MVKFQLMQKYDLINWLRTWPSAEIFPREVQHPHFAYHFQVSCNRRSQKALEVLSPNFQGVKCPFCPSCRRPWKLAIAIKLNIPAYAKHKFLRTSLLRQTHPARWKYSASLQSTATDLQTGSNTSIHSTHGDSRLVRLLRAPSHQL